MTERTFTVYFPEKTKEEFVNQSKISEELKVDQFSEYINSKRKSDLITYLKNISDGYTENHIFTTRELGLGFYDITTYSNHESIIFALLNIIFVSDSTKTQNNFKTISGDIYDNKDDYYKLVKYLTQIWLDKMQDDSSKTGKFNPELQERKGPFEFWLFLLILTFNLHEVFFETKYSRFVITSQEKISSEEEDDYLENLAKILFKQSRLHDKFNDTCNNWFANIYNLYSIADEPQIRLNALSFWKKTFENEMMRENAQELILKLNELGELKKFKSNIYEKDGTNSISLIFNPDRPDKKILVFEFDDNYLVISIEGKFLNNILELIQDILKGDRQKLTKIIMKQTNAVSTTLKFNAVLLNIKAPKMVLFMDVVNISIFGFSKISFEDQEKSLK